MFDRNAALIDAANQCWRRYIEAPPQGLWFAYPVPYGATGAEFLTAVREACPPYYTIDAEADVMLSDGKVWIHWTVEKASTELDYV